ncbi:thiosulfate sulfurtransferase [Aeropyrum pernix K1]|uniref:Sulfurtransferase n=1 Tax=Aeropyrum pernix (strain ATCC 700893 / DSM 11879 / JCM 9820 / NBRC 100138 / K1) TaxID=272557 RepID=Q9Y8N8_AERPE|nr:sulfurtransferase [Aeropyrum pernix]BAA81612.2 thiosulfate sulfurtransferase [Aeropyrum pernix K1]
MGADYPGPLVSIEWLEANIKRSDVKVIEVDYDPATAYFIGHIPGALLIDWKRDLNKYPERDIIDPEGFERLMSRLGVENGDHVILYGDYNNWFAAFAYWVFKMYGHQRVSLLDGGRSKWIALGKPMSRPATREPPRAERESRYRVVTVDSRYRVFFLDILRKLNDPNTVLVDVRSPEEYRGDITAPPEYPEEQAQRGGHIPGALNIPWKQAVRDDGSFKSPEELRSLYEDRGVTPDKEVIVYCRIGERASHTWFVLKELLGYPNVAVYDGSWSEWGNMVRAPVKKGDEP